MDGRPKRIKKFAFTSVCVYNRLRVDGAKEIRHTREKSIGRPTSPRTSVFLEAIFSRNGPKIYKISSKNNPSVVPFQIDCDYCLDGKRNNRNSTG